MRLPVSVRAIPALSLLLVLALVPTIVHSYRGFEVEAAPIDETVLPARIDGLPGVAVPRSGRWVRLSYGTDSWAERRYGSTAGALTLFVVRGSDLKKIYHHPELGVFRGQSFERVEIVALQGDDSRPVHVLKNVAPGGNSAIYALVYEDEWVGNPYWLQLRSAVSSLWAGKRPIALVMASGDDVLDASGAPTTRASAAIAAVVDAVMAASSTR